MEMNPGALPRPGRVPAQELCPPKLDGDGGGDRNCFWRKGVWNQGFLRGGKNRAKGGTRGAIGQPGGFPARPRGGRARDPSGVPVVALPSFLGDSRSFRDADFLYNFSGIFGALLMAGKPEIQK